MQHQRVRKGVDLVQRVNMTVDDQLMLQTHARILAEHPLQAVERILAPRYEQHVQAETSCFAHIRISAYQQAVTTPVRGTPRLSRGSVAAKPERLSVGASTGMNSGIVKPVILTRTY